MYISRVRLENIRGFSGPRNVDLTLTRPDGSHAGWTVLAGRNGSGKTSLLRAIALAVGGPITTAALNHDFRKWITTDQQQATAEVQLHAARGSYGPWVDDPWDNRGNAHVKDLTGRLTWTAFTDHGSSKPGGLPLFNAATSPDVGMDGPWGANPFGWFCVAYGPFRRLFGGTSEAQRLMSSPGPVGRLASLFHEDATLAEGVQWLIEMHLRALEGDELNRQLKESALQLLGDGLFPHDYQISDVTSDGLWVSHQGDRFPLREMSDGYRTVAALVVDLLSRLYNFYGPIPLDYSDGTPVIMNPGVVLIDEADAHLHVTWQQRIAGWLKKHFPNIQFWFNRGYDRDNESEHDKRAEVVAVGGGTVRSSEPRVAVETLSAATRSTGLRHSSCHAYPVLLSRGGRWRKDAAPGL